jgi:hypothetical protein
MPPPPVLPTAAQIALEVTQVRRILEQTLTLIAQSQAGRITPQEAQMLLDELKQPPNPEWRRS